MKKIITFLFPFILVPLMGCNSYSPVGTFINFEEISNTSILTKEEVINLAYNVSINHVVYDKDRNIYEYPNSIIKSIEN